MGIVESTELQEGSSLSKIKLDAENFRRHGLQNIFGDPLYGTDEKYNFYYDETNNIRSLYLTNNGTNAEFKNFVLGGIVHYPDNENIDTDYLKKILSLQKTAKEIKFKQLATGNFLGVLNSQKINLFLNWLIENDIYIHYSNFNTLYWSIVDIVDSCWSHPPLKKFMEYNRELKNELFRLCSIDKIQFTKILKKYNYPNIQRNQGYNFLEDLTVYFESIMPISSNQISRLLISILKKAKGSKELDFLVDNDNDTLIDNFFDLYLRPVCLFPNSIHTFDEEKKIQKEFNKYSIFYKNTTIDYKFVKSIDHIKIQLSDVICGLLGSYFNYLEEFTIQALLSHKEALNQRQVENLKLLRLLIEKSDYISNGFIHRTAPMDSDAKSNFYLFDMEPAGFLFL